MRRRHGNELLNRRRKLLERLGVSGIGVERYGECHYSGDSENGDTSAMHWERYDKTPRRRFVMEDPYAFLFVHS